MNQCGCTETAAEWKGNWDPFVRLSYQFGMLLGVDELAQEQGFHLTKHRLVQRLFTGFGRVWGGDTAISQNSEGRSVLTVKPLFALDELGRELWVKEPCSIDLDLWAEQNGVVEGTPVYLTVSYRACSVAPVPAVAAPCDDAASPTMPSRAVESAELSLSLEPPDEPISLAPGGSTSPYGDTQAARFATLVALVREDLPRPLLLETFVLSTTVVNDRSTPTWQSEGIAAPTLRFFQDVPFQVLSASVQDDNLTLEFSLPPAVAPIHGFHLDRFTTGEGDFLVVNELLHTGVAPVRDPENPRRLTLKLYEPIVAGDNYRIRVDGTGRDAVLALGPNGLLPLGGGADFTLHARS